MNKFSDLSEIKEPELSEEERLEKEARIEKYGMTMRKMIDDAHEKAGKLKDRPTDVGISPESIEKMEKADSLIHSWESATERIIDPETQELLEHFCSTIKALFEELDECLGLQNLRNACDNGNKQWRDNAGGKGTKDKYSHIYTVVKAVADRYMQDRPHMLGVGVYKRGAKKELEDLIKVEMSKEENYKTANLISCPSNLTIQKYRKMLFVELGLPK
ncbi:MAG: hypothetical protein ACJAR3_001987 [Roseivirga sp.]|jgi:hypothetical protein